MPISPKFVTAFHFLEHVAFIYLLLKVVFFLKANGVNGLIKKIISTAAVIPGLSDVIEKEVAKEIVKIEEKMLGDGDADANVVLPEKSLNMDEIVEKVKALQEKDKFLGNDKKWAGIYHDTSGEDPLDELHAKVWSMFSNSNSLYPGVFPSVRKFEAEITQMVCSLLNGKTTECGLLTSGGTESILVCMLTYRELARAYGISSPEVICCSNAHPALDKAAFYFGLKLVKLSVDEDTLRLPTKKLLDEINSSTVCIYTSAPSFPHGTVDDIQSICVLIEKNFPDRFYSSLGMGKDIKTCPICIHVDNCLGGFYLSFKNQLSEKKIRFDFDVEGVTSISVDVHKYGYAPKGSSVALFKDKKLRAMSVHPVTTGLTLYVTPTLQGSRSGANIAAAWATLLYHGSAGYRKSAEAFSHFHQETTATINETVRQLHAFETDLAIIPIAVSSASKLKPEDIYAVASLLQKLGWSVFTSQNPPLLQLAYGEQHIRNPTLGSEFITALKSAVNEVEKLRISGQAVEISGESAVYGAAKLLPPSVLESVLKRYVDVTLTVKKKSKEKTI